MLKQFMLLLEKQESHCITRRFLFGGMASDISALITENCFEYLDAPVKRVGSIETPIPFEKELEKQYLAKNLFEKELLAILNY